MIETSGAKIFLADQRGCTESANHRSFHTFNFGSYISRHREPFESLLTLNDETLAAGQSIRYECGDLTECIVIPLVGSCLCSKDETVRETDVGEVFHCVNREKGFIEIANPFEREPINYLYLELRSMLDAMCETAPFDLEQKPNVLHKINLYSMQQVAIGIFDGREECSVKFEKMRKDVFVFVIEGAFEVNNRLLHKRDGLAIWQTKQLEFEALSNRAIILAITLLPGVVFDIN